MKVSILMVALAIMSVSGAKAGELNASSPWADIQQSVSLWPEFPSVEFQGGAVLNVDQLCVSGDKLVGFDPYNECVAWNDSADDTTCKTYQGGVVSTPIQHTVQVCLDRNSENGDCYQYQNEVETYSLDYQVRVYENHAMDDERLAFTKKFVIPACK